MLKDFCIGSKIKFSEPLHLLGISRDIWYKNEFTDKFIVSMSLTQINNNDYVFIFFLDELSIMNILYNRKSNSLDKAHTDLFQWLLANKNRVERLLPFQ